MLLVACADLRLLGSQGWIEVFTETPALESGPLSCASTYAFTNTTGDYVGLQAMLPSVRLHGPHA